MQRFIPWQWQLLYVALPTLASHFLTFAIPQPVTSWRLYDSIYTERYMNTPQLNPGGYVNASITNVTGFKHIDYLLAHGSGDDNVHYANSAHLLDMFTKAQVRKYRFRMFTDRYVQNFPKLVRGGHTNRPLRTPVTTAYRGEGPIGRCTNTSLLSSRRSGVEVLGDGSRLGCGGGVSACVFMYWTGHLPTSTDHYSAQQVRLIAEPRVAK